MGHLRFAHKPLRLPNDWYTQSVIQVKKGLGKQRANIRKKIALHKKDVQHMVRQVETEEPELAGLLAVARLFLLRVPLEAVPLQWNGPPSAVHLEEAQATIILTKRKTGLRRRHWCVSAAAIRLDATCAQSTGYIAYG